MAQPCHFAAHNISISPFHAKTYVKLLKKVRILDRHTKQQKQDDRQDDPGPKPQGPAQPFWKAHRAQTQTDQQDRVGRVCQVRETVAETVG